MDVRATYACVANVPRDNVGEPGWAAHVDVACGDVGNELEQMVGREVMPPFVGCVVADDVMELRAGRARELVELRPEENVFVGDDAVDDDDVAAHLLQECTHGG